MTVQSYVGRAPRPSSLADVLELILDKGLVVDAYVRVSLVGIELLTIDARVVVASVDTYLRFAEATNRLDLQAASNSEGLPQLIGDLTEGGASQKTKGALSGAADRVSSWFGGGDDENSRNGGGDDGDERRRRPARASASRSRSRSRDGEDEPRSSRRNGNGSGSGRRRRPRDDGDEGG